VSVNLEPDVRVENHHLRKMAQRYDSEIMTLRSTRARLRTVCRKVLMAHEDNDPLAMERIVALIREELVEE